MQKKEFIIEGMSCNHCVMSINKALSTLGGVNVIDINLDKKRVVIEYDEYKTPFTLVSKAIVDAGYEVAGH